MQLLAHLTLYETAPLLGVYLLGVLSGVTLAWLIGRRWLLPPD